MQEIPFYKYHGTGNDFIIIDHMKNNYLDESDTKLIKSICSRRFGVGGDGLMIIKPSEEYDFEMLYYNSDGNISSMCGNGGRCISKASVNLGYSPKGNIRFMFRNDVYQSHFISDKNWVSLKMQNVENVTMDNNAYVLDTGSPHYVTFINDVENLNVKKVGSEIRYNAIYASNGINVNFCCFSDKLHVRTYERGVEDETYSCGTGVVASAIANSLKSNLDDGFIETKIATLGGLLSVSFIKEQNSFRDIYLNGPAVKVFTGNFHI